MVDGLDPRQDDLRDHSIAELLRQLSQETATLVRQEMELAKAEVAQKGKKAGAGAAMFGGAGAAGLATLGAFTAFLILVLNTVMDAWLAALIVTLVYGAITAVLIMRGKEKVQEAGSPVPEQTVDTIKEDIEWAKNPRTSATR
ncbi:MAG: phage holin family protein [Actinomycetota bacterium]|nr:phage holin family protein [Actinomycetota bacterium]